MLFTVERSVAGAVTRMDLANRPGAVVLSPTNIQIFAVWCFSTNYSVWWDVSTVCRLPIEALFTQNLSELTFITWATSLHCWTYLELLHSNLFAAVRNVSNVFGGDHFGGDPIAFVESPTYVDRGAIYVVTTLEGCGWYGTASSGGVNPIVRYNYNLSSKWQLRNNLSLTCHNFFFDSNFVTAI